MQMQLIALSFKVRDRVRTVQNITSTAFLSKITTFLHLKT